MRTSAVAAAVLFAAGVSGQTSPPKAVFEVASVKHLGVERPNGAGSGSTGIAPPLTGDPIHLSYTEVSLVGVLCRAYDVKPMLIEGPDWIQTERYSISAKVPDDAPKGHIPEMLQNLLADRFRMTVHWDTREENGYALTVGKTGPKLKKTDPSEAHSFSMSRSGHFAWKGSTLDEFVTSLTLFMDRPVVDMTALEGTFDIVIDAAPDSMQGIPSRDANVDSPYPSIFAAVRELGLNLEPRKVPVKHLVVDSAQKVPTAN